jgi:hypothetical protein
LATVVEPLPAEHELDHGVMDKGDDRDKIRNTLREDDRAPVILPAAIARNPVHPPQRSISYGPKSNA